MAGYGQSRNPDGRPGKWRLGKTRTIRVPEAIADTLLQVAEELDKKGMQDLTQNLEQHKSSS
jgi:hypothetical protein